MTGIEERFRDHFSPWGITIPSEHVRERRRGKLVEGGWAIWYLYGEDERGEYLDYYASHRMTDDRHVRIYESGEVERLPTINTFRLVSQDPEEDARLEAEYLDKNRRVARMLEEKGFGAEGDEPGGVLINRYLRLGGEAEE
jgi:hypothetical protein